MFAPLHRGDRAATHEESDVRGDHLGFGLCMCACHAHLILTADVIYTRPPSWVVPSRVILTLQPLMRANDDPEQEEWEDIQADQDLIEMARHQPCQEGLLSLDSAQRLAMEYGLSLPDMLSSANLASFTAMLPSSLTSEGSSGRCAGAALLGAGIGIATAGPIAGAALASAAGECPRVSSKHAARSDAPCPLPPPRVVAPTSRRDRLRRLAPAAAGGAGAPPHGAEASDGRGAAADGRGGRARRGARPPGGSTRAAGR